MQKTDLTKKFVLNLSYAFIAQLLSLLLSVLMSLIVPKLVGVEQFAYWQLFIFYSTYVGLFHFGLPDGIYLRYGGIEIDSMDKNLLGSQLRMMNLFHVAISIIGVLVIFSLPIEVDRKFVWVFTAVYMIITNAFWFLGYVYQAANKTKIFSVSTIISKVSFTICVLVLMVLKPEDFKVYVILYVIAQSLALFYCVYKGKEFVFSHQISMRRTLSEMLYNAKIGINLTISNIASSFILGVGRVVIDATHGISSFGLISLSISLVNFFLQFVSQVSMVMFPMLRQFKHDKMKQVFVTVRSGISYLLCLILLLYIPIKIVFLWWLPQYKESLNYMAFLFPICVFDGKMQLLFNTYMKVLRKERMMLFINLLSLSISTILCSIGAFIIGNVVAVAVAMTLATVVRGIIANLYLSRVMDISMDKNAIWEIVLALLFIISNFYLSNIAAFVFYGISYGLYLMANKREIKKILTKIMANILKRRKDK